ncbi:glycosyltransferase family 2 protein [Acidomonas methanolica]|uniref:Glycosyl transferase n=1 Tax=Acidomonas methanolica NBRC 104435 TaxID=1231351 RepID=A0A023D2G3_ACIMT|nr:glycosyltransferase family A protein [Acidomonas methanolica]TCS30609.1 glycosyl transferase family 2 [Acidomonas methanolica]GAJ28348.1 glycosyl transferase [Acidomonas methanolica NBRC 104435]GEK98832.1 hypothetical protein AME01nite_13310 [Acidomonas methanolica NBRC 104435]
MAIVDVLMPVYNAAAYLTDALRSIQAQTVQDIRIIVVDDGSTDGTEELVLEARKNDPRIVYLYQENAGIVAALNAGLDLCTAPFLARMDGDDISCPDRFQRELAYLSDNPGCIAVSCVAHHIDETGKRTGTSSRRKDVATADPFSLPADEPYLLHPMLMARLEAVKSVGGYRPIYNAEDSDLYWRLSHVGRLHVLPEYLGEYRVHSNSLSSASIRNGRLLAVWSQLAALSAQRRSSGQPDFPFGPAIAHDVARQKTLAAMVETVMPHLSHAEGVWYRSAVSAKLIELCYYRPYEPDAEDIQFILEAAAHDREIASRKKYDVFREGILSASIRLLMAKRYRDAFALTAPERWPVLIARTMFRVALPESVKTRIKTSLRR